MEVSITVQNNVCNLIADENIIKDVREYLSVENSNYFFMRKHNPYAPKRFYFCTEKGRFATGFLHFIVNLLQKSGIQVNIIDQRNNLVPFDTEFSDDVWHYKLRDYQSEAVQSFNQTKNGLYWPRGVFDGAVNTGKMPILKSLLVNIPAERNLILIHKQELKQQLYDFLSPTFKVGFIHGKHNDTKSEVVIGMYKTVYSRLQDSSITKYLKSVQTLLVDECHVAQSPEFSKLIMKIDAGQRMFLSGTPYTTKDNVKKMKLLGLAGETVMKRTTEQNVKEGVSNPVKVRFFKVNHKGYLDYPDSYKNGVVLNEEKANKIEQYVTQNADKQILIAVKLKEHGFYLFEKLKKICNCRLVFGDSFGREGLLSDFKKGSFQVAITTVWNEGINAPIDTLIYARGESDYTNLEQYIGRILRTEGKTQTGEIIDFFDNRCKYLEEHSKNRLKHYEGIKVQGISYE